MMRGLYFSPVLWEMPCMQVVPMQPSQTRVTESIYKQKPSLYPLHITTFKMLKTSSGLWRPTPTHLPHLRLCLVFLGAEQMCLPSPQTSWWSDGQRRSARGCGPAGGWLGPRPCSRRSLQAATWLGRARSQRPTSEMGIWGPTRTDC